MTSLGDRWYNEDSHIYFIYIIDEVAYTHAQNIPLECVSSTSELGVVPRLFNKIYWLRIRWMTFVIFTEPGRPIHGILFFKTDRPFYDIHHLFKIIHYLDMSAHCFCQTPELITPRSEHLWTFSWSIMIDHLQVIVRVVWTLLCLVFLSKRWNFWKWWKTADILKINYDLSHTGHERSIINLLIPGVVL